MFASARSFVHVFCRVYSTSHDSVERHIDHCRSHSVCQRRPRSQHCPAIQPHRALCGRQMDQGQPQANSQVIAYSTTVWHQFASAGSVAHRAIEAQPEYVQCISRSTKSSESQAVLLDGRAPHLQFTKQCQLRAPINALCSQRQRGITSRILRMCGHTCSVLLAVAATALFITHADTHSDVVVHAHTHATRYSAACLLFAN